jgi:hypothetical protein
MAALERVLWYLNFVATLVLLFRLACCKLAGIYRFLFLYWFAQATATLVMLPVPLTSNSYAYLYFGAQTVNVILAICVVQELNRLALASHPALAAFGRNSVLVVAAIGAVLAAFGVILDSKVLPGQYQAVHRFLTLERTMDFMVLMFLLLISGFMVWFPVKVRRNIVVYITGFVVFHASRSFGLLLTNLLPQADSKPLSIAMLAVSLACLLVWMIGLQREGEHVTTVTGHRWNPAAIGRLSEQLDAINAALVRFVRS